MNDVVNFGVLAELAAINRALAVTDFIFILFNAVLYTISLLSFCSMFDQVISEFETLYLIFSHATCLYSQIASE
jgi:hypothetical protein